MMTLSLPSSLPQHRSWLGAAVFVTLCLLHIHPCHCYLPVGALKFQNQAAAATVFRERASVFLLRSATTVVVDQENSSNMASSSSSSSSTQDTQSPQQQFPEYTETQLKEALESLLQGSERPEYDARHIYGYGNPDHKLSMLQTISATRMLDVQFRMQDPSAPSEQDLIQQAQETWPVSHRLDLQHVIQEQQPSMALAAEFKRASPSKGDIAPHLHAGEQAAVYHKAGASIISILTEPHWFQGSLGDLTQARMSTSNETAIPSLSRRRPAILRKDFVVNEYMIAEAAAAGADTILLIVAILPQHILTRLISYARTVHHMEPLVEVHGDDELQVAIEAGAKVIGVNNRNLHTFQLDLETSERIASQLEQLKQQQQQQTQIGGSYQSLPEYTLCALSGMSTALDVDRYRRAGISMCLIGESLMRAADPAQAIRSLCLNPNDFELLQQQQKPPLSVSGGEAVTSDSIVGAYIGGTKLIKVCGITNAEDALVACRAGANLIGVIFVPKSKRCVTVDQATEVVQAVQAFGERTGPVTFWNADQNGQSKNPLLRLVAASQALERASRRPLVVGVFQNQDAGYIKSMVKQCGLDLVQLHGQEGMAAANTELCGVPAIRVVDMETDPTTGSSTPDAAETLLASLTCDPVAILLDTSIKGATAGGGTGVTFDWTVAQKVQASGLPVIIAGGLEPNNVKEAVSTIRPWGVDVSSGVEEQPGKKDHSKVQDFVKGARASSIESNKGF